MTSKVRRSKYKGVKWINTRYSKPYRIRLAIRSIHCAALASASLERLNQIRFANADTKQEKVAKAISMAQVVLDTQVAISKLYGVERALNNAVFEHGIMNHKAGDVQRC